MVQPRLMMPSAFAWLVVSQASAQIDFMHLRSPSCSELRSHGGCGERLQQTSRCQVTNKMLYLNMCQAEAQETYCPDHASSGTAAIQAELVCGIACRLARTYDKGQQAG